MNRPAFLALALAVAAATLAAAPAGVSVRGAWSRPATDEGVVYLTIRNATAHAVVLTGGASPVAKTVQLHESMRMHGATMGGMTMGAMGMEPAARVTVPAHGALALRPGGYHLMLLGLRHPLAAGQTFPITLRFANGARATTVVSVENRAM
jgi:copper(I)-binding protein